MTESSLSAVRHRHHHVDPTELVPLADYRDEILGRIEPLAAIELGLLEAHGCVLAEDIAADGPVPPFANSAMDGYALRAADTGPDVELSVAGEVAAGAADVTEVAAGSAVRIMTGAPLPPGADAVVPVEMVREAGDRIRLGTTAQAGDNVRSAGEDVAAGDVILRAGRRLRAADVGMLAAIGHARVWVRPRPRAVVISTGDELVDPGTPLRAGQIPDANSHTLVAQVREAEATAYRHAIVPDDRRALVEAFEGALSHADLLITSGGVSAGRYDLVKQVLAELGDVRFQKVAMQPGMPQAFGFVRDVPCFGLPGNPVSAYVSFEVFVRPALRRLQGRDDLNRPRIGARLEAAVPSPPHKVSFLRVRLRRDGNDWFARTTGPQGSGILRSCVEADGLAEIPAERTVMDAGEQVVVHLLAG